MKKKKIKKIIKNHYKQNGYKQLLYPLIHNVIHYSDFFILLQQKMSAIVVGTDTAITKKSNAMTVAKVQLLDVINVLIVIPDVIEKDAILITWAKRVRLIDLGMLRQFSICL